MIHKNIVVLDSEHKGRGIFASAPITKEEIIWTEEGLIHHYFTKEELAKLDEKYALLAYWNGESYQIDDDDPGNYMNHSCNPNTWWQDGKLVARRNINNNEEITYDYSTTDIYGINGIYPSMLCFCKDPICRKTIYPDDLITHPELQKIYAGHLPPTTLNWLSKHANN